jgi:uncharacterized protein YbjT (DUF2867 family)
LVYPGAMRKLVTVFGGSGFVGAHVIRALAKADWRVRVAVREPHLAEHLRLAGDVGQVQVTQANIRFPDSVARALEGAEACVNLVAVLHSAGRQTFQGVHVDGARNVACAVKAAGITQLVHFSALGADAGSASEYAASKAAGEAAVRAEVPEAVIVRPSIVFGPGDAFFNRFGAMAAMSPVLPLIGGGHTRFQPVYVADVAQAVRRALDGGAEGQTFELAGPKVYSFRELMEIVLAETGRKRLLAPIPFPIAKLIGLSGVAMAFIGLDPPLTPDQVELLKADNVATGAPGLAELGIAPMALEPVISTYLYRYRKGGQYAEGTHLIRPPDASVAT